MNSQQLRKKLQDVLQKDPENTDKILSLSSKLAALDKDKVRFSVDAGVIDRLGKELVARQETAVSELIKNAYDADATEVDLDFKDVDSKGGILIIVDNGSGMTRKELIRGFMRISSTDKIHNPNSNIYDRIRAGKKGIGRFATQRLGNKLTVITQTSSSRKAHKVTIDWANYKIDDELYLVTNKIDEIPRSKEIVSGTILRIENLRDWWSEAMIKRVYRYALDIIQPFPLSKKKIVNNKIPDPGFTVTCRKDSVAIADKQSMFYKHALAQIEGSIDVQGKATWKITKSKVEGITTKGQLLESDNDVLKGRFKYLNGVRFKAYYFVYYQNLMPKQIESYVRESSKDKGGIRCYRNGFRVLPYAEPEDDWLRLDASVRRNTILPPHGNNNFFGFVEIDGGNKNFIELSSREGLYHNDAYEELVEFIYKALSAAVTRIGEARGRKTRTGQKDWKKKQPKRIKEDILDTADEFDKIADELENDNSNSSKNEKGKEENKNESSDKKRERAKDYRSRAKNLRDAVQQIEEISMLRVLAGLGLIIGEFTHEILQYLGTFDIDSQYLVDNLKKNTEVYKRAIRLKETFNSFQVYASYFDESISKNVNRELEIINLKATVNGFKESLESDLERNNINMELDFFGDEIYTKKMHESEWASILFNLYSNAKKALKRKNPKERRIKIQVGIHDQNVYLNFHDNGDGIAKENKDKIFNAFFTTSTPKGHNSNLNEEMAGTGLGLKILQDIINGYNGEIMLDNPAKKYVTSFRIEVPKASDEEIEELWNID